MSHDVDPRDEGATGAHRDDRIDQPIAPAVHDPGGPVWGVPTEVAWQHDPTVRALLDGAPAAPGTSGPDSGSTDQPGTFVLVNGIATVVSLTRAQALEAGYTLLDLDASQHSLVGTTTPPGDADGAGAPTPPARPPLRLVVRDGASAHRQEMQDWLRAVSRGRGTASAGAPPVRPVSSLPPRRGAVARDVSMAASVEGAVALAASAPVAAAPALTVVPPLEVPPVEEAPVLDAPALDVPPLVELPVEPPAVDLPGLEVPEALVEALPSVTLPVPPPEAPWSADAPAPTVPDFLVVDLPAAPDESADQTLHVVAAPPDHAPLSGTITAPAPTPTPASSPLRPPLPASARSVAAARAIAKRVGRGASARELFRSVTLDLAEGEFLGVVGPSGAGKSMLLSCLSGLVRPDAGDVLIDGTPVTALTESDRALQRVGTMGFATSTPGLVGVLTAQENVELPLQIAGWSRSDASKEATAALTLLRVEDLADALPDTLSGGERVKVTLARALVGEPKIVWADEPTAGLDPGSADDVAHVLRQLNEDGLAVVVVTHDPRLLQHAHRIVELRDGAVREASRRKVLDECRRPFR